MENQVLIVISGGVMQDVTFAKNSARIKIIVKDYDVEGDDLNDDNIKIDDQGNYYREIIWEHEPSESQKT